jgi:hypothetical protein
MMADWESPHIRGFESERLREICRDHNAFYGEPPCWTLDNTDGEEPEEITPCDGCQREYQERIAEW